MSFWSSFHLYLYLAGIIFPRSVGAKQSGKPARAALSSSSSTSPTPSPSSLAAARRDNDNELGFALQDFGKLFDGQVRCLYHIYEVNPHFCPIIWLTFHLLDHGFVLRRTCLQIGNIELKQRSTGASLGNHGPRMRCPF